MSNDELVYSTITDEARIPGARMTWGPRKCEPPMPYFTYEERPRSYFADDCNYASLPRYRVTLVDKQPHGPAHDRMRAAMESLGTYRWYPAEYDEERRAWAHGFDLNLVRRDRA